MQGLVTVKPTGAPVAVGTLSVPACYRHPADPSNVYMLVSPDAPWTVPAGTRAAVNLSTGELGTIPSGQTVTPEDYAFAPA